MVCRRESNALIESSQVSESAMLADDSRSSNAVSLRISPTMVVAAIGVFGILGLVAAIISGGDASVHTSVTPGRGLSDSVVHRDGAAARQPPQGDPARDVAALSRARSRVRLELYSTSWCPHCEHARQYLRQQGYSFTEYDIDRDSRASDRMHRLNPSGSIPFLVADGTETARGFGAASYEDVIDRAARAHLR